MLRVGLAANARRTVHGRAKLALAPALYFRKFRLVILLIVSLLFHCANLLLLSVVCCSVEITTRPYGNRVCAKTERADYAFLRQISSGIFTKCLVTSCALCACWSEMRQMPNKLRIFSEVRCPA